MQALDGVIRTILTKTRTIALVGASPDATRDSHQVMAFLQGCGYRVIPVNPSIAGQVLLGERTYADVLQIPGEVDMVDIFRNSKDAGDVADQAIAKGAKYVWMQLGVINPPAAARAEAMGLLAIMDRCPKIEIRRLGIAPVLHD